MYKQSKRIEREDTISFHDPLLTNRDRNFSDQTHTFPPLCIAMLLFGVYKMQPRGSNHGDYDIRWYISAA